MPYNWFRSLITSMAVCASLLSLVSIQGRSQTTPTKPRSTGHADPKINEQFHKAKVKDFIKRFEAHDREVFAKRHEITKALELRPGMAVADIGAGTGLFTRLFADVVGPGGKVYAVDISKDFLKHITAQSKAKGQPQVVTILGTQDSTKLPPASIDLAFLSDVYHHFEKPDRTLASIYKALRPGGILVVIDFDRVEGKSSEFVLKHIRASQAVFRGEIESAGFECVPTPKAPRMKENFFLRFRKREPTRRETSSSDETSSHNNK